MCNSNKFPFKFCSTRWLENVSVAERDLELFNDIKKLFENSKLQNNHQSSSENGLGDLLVKPKLSNFYCQLLILWNHFYYDSFSPVGH